MARKRRRRPTRREQYESAAYRELQARVAANVLKLREKAGLTQEEAAHECGMGTRLFQSIEGEETNATLTTLARLCEGLGVDPSALFRRPR